MPKRKVQKTASARGLTLGEARELAFVRSRPDVPKVMALRMRLLERLDQDFEWFYAQLINSIAFGHKDFEPSTRMVMRLLDSLLPTMREIIQQPDMTQPATNVPTIKIYNVNRGTEQARQEAISIKTERQRAADRAA